MDKTISDLVKMKDVETLYEVMTENDDWMLCLDAAEGLAILNDMRGVEFLQDATESEDDEIRGVAEEILASPTVSRLRDEIKVIEQKKREEGTAIARQRIKDGKKVFRYQTLYLPISDFIAEGIDEAVGVPALDEFGMDGWEVAAYLGYRDTSSALAPGRRPSGGYFLLKKEITASEIGELDEM